MAEIELITFLPNEIIEVILDNEILDFRDVLNFSRSCKYLHRVVAQSNKLWKSKFFHRWSSLKDIYSEYNLLNNVSNWLDEVRLSAQSRMELRHQLAMMSAKYFKKQELSDSELKNFDPLFQPELNAHSRAYYFLVDELISLIDESPLTSNLTIRYYAFKVVRYLKQTHIKKEWQKFVQLPTKSQLLELGATIVSQWSQPEKYVLYSKICATLDEIAEQSKNKLREKNPNHPIFNVAPEQFDDWRCNNIDDNQWSPTNTKLIITALCDVIYNDLGFHGNNEMYYSSENSFIDAVLEQRRGIPITLSIVFESISRRLGVKCEPVSFPAHFLLRWKEKYLERDSDDIESYYIDVFNGGQFMTRKSCPRLVGESKCPMDRNIRNAATAVEVVERMAANLGVAGRQRTHLNGRASRLRSALELLHLVHPYDTSAILHLGRFYMLYQMDSSSLVNILTQMQEDSHLLSRGPVNHIQQMLLDYENHRTSTEESFEVKLRTPIVKYAIGMIMKHQRYNYLCVITGWDERCRASPEWMSEMGVDELKYGANQPFYTVFADDGSSRYAAQENLAIATPPTWIDHYEIGRYFSHFQKTHYIPNEEKRKEYPEDDSERKKFFSSYL